jgi:hypothetical protein
MATFDASQLLVNVAAMGPAKSADHGNTHEAPEKIKAVVADATETTITESTKAIAPVTVNQQTLSKVESAESVAIPVSKQEEPPVPATKAVKQEAAESSIIDSTAESKSNLDTATMKNFVASV